MVVALREAAARHGLRLLGHVPETLTYEEAMLPDTQHLMGVAPMVSPLHRLVAQRGWDRVGDERLREVSDFAVRNGLANTPTLVLDQQVLSLASDAAAKASPAGQLMPRFYRDVVWDPQRGVPAYRGLQRADFDLVRAALAGKMKLVRRLHEAGAQLYLGTDVQQPYVVPGLALQQEMRLFAESGIPVEDIWAIGTSQSGRSLGLAQLGTIAPGAPADLLIFARDPTTDLDAMSSLQAVVSRGRLYTKEDLDAKVAAYQSHYAGLAFDSLSTVLAAAAVRKTLGH
jgi:Amidohydrolase family